VLLGREPAPDRERVDGDAQERDREDVRAERESRCGATQDLQRDRARCARVERAGV